MIKEHTEDRCKVAKERSVLHEDKGRLNRVDSSDSTYMYVMGVITIGLSIADSSRGGRQNCSSSFVFIPYVYFRYTCIF